MANLTDVIDIYVDLRERIRKAKQDGEKWVVIPLDVE